ncbi:hypothetical protein [Sphingobium sp. WCS2017Hpa-17]|uniref:hypothetical protein n=1 Tax=Sphingobium sp. WCS2017Hpa-17 TaxID=3073638 RepID=UPI00288AA035|nr:hypothetical protein [Sphingobium sp. WCS2017Hpa-17]
MQFRLTYQGLVLSETNKGRLQNARATEKQRIRKIFHKQIRRLWEINPYLSSFGKPLSSGKMPGPGTAIFGRPHNNNSIKSLSIKHALGSYNFVPLVTRDLEIGCDIQVLFLRDDRVGDVLRAGDIDNRLKTLFDALTMPQSLSQVGSYEEPEPDEMPFFCLLEDDSLITKVNVETDTLLEPVSSIEGGAARVIITVRTNLFRVSSKNIGFA